MKIYSLDDVFFFGKFKGKTMKEVLDSSDGKNYVKWAIGKSMLALDEEAKTFARTGKIVEKPKVDITTLDFWQRLVIQGPRDDCPF
jgi:hypothetical protein